jgi:DNA end-binding protein Ku
MSARAIWKGILRAGRHDVPVKLYSAVEDHTVHFNMLDRKSRRRVTQRMVDPESGDEVDRDQIRRGYEVEPGTFVILKEAELAEIEPPESREITTRSRRLLQKRKRRRSRAGSCEKRSTSVPCARKEGTSC